MTNRRHLLIFLCFLARQQARLPAHKRDLLFQSRAEEILPPHPEFFRRLPEFTHWQSHSASWWKKGADELERLEEQGLQYVLDTDSSFPPNLRELNLPPWVLTVKGQAQALKDPVLSVVGAREPQPESLQWMEQHLGEFLRKMPVQIASGGARGIDQAAHRTALRNGRPTLVFLPSGLQTLYPADLSEWILPVCESGGAFVSEFHPRTPMRKWHFQMRNRLIAGLGPLTLVIEAKMKSGTWLTAQLANSEGRNVACLPASVWDPALSGNLQLLTDGAMMVRDAQDLLIAFTREQLGHQRRSLAIASAQLTLH